MKVYVSKESKRRDEIHRLFIPVGECFRFYCTYFICHRSTSCSCRWLYEDYALYRYGCHAPHLLRDRHCIVAAVENTWHAGRKRKWFIFWNHFLVYFHLQRKDIDESMDEEVFDQDLYFKRYEIMTRFLSKQYPDLEETFLDHLWKNFTGNYSKKTRNSLFSHCNCATICKIKNEQKDPESIFYRSKI